MMPFSGCRRTAIHCRVMACPTVKPAALRSRALTFAATLSCFIASSVVIPFFSTKT
jgi:hypothetical protein